MNLVNYYYNKIRKKIEKLQKSIYNLFFCEIQPNKNNIGNQLLFVYLLA